MKINKLFLALAAAVTALSAVSCQTDEPDVFEQSSSARMQSYIKEVQQIITSGEATWVFECYPGSGQSYGGYAFVVSFTDKEVTACSELDPTQSCTSLYKFTYDNGPVLSFDTNNEVLHYFATPSNKLYQAYGGDFEFTILEYEQDYLRLVGKRSGNNCYLRRFEGTTPKDYVQGVVELEDNYRASQIEGNIGETAVTGTVDLVSRSMTIIYGEEEDDTVTMPFAFTPDGLRFYNEVDVKGYKFDRLWYLSENNILTNGVITLKGKLPDDYKAYGEFAGNFTLTYYNGSRTYNVTLTPVEGGYEMSGINSNYTVFLGYDKGRGRLTWNSQVVGNNGDNQVYLCAWALGSGGSLTWATTAGVTIHWVEENGQFEFEDNGAWEGKSVDSFILWEVSSAGSVGQFTGWGSSQIAHLTSLKRR